MSACHILFQQVPATNTFLENVEFSLCCYDAADELSHSREFVTSWIVVSPCYGVHQSLTGGCVIETNVWRHNIVHSDNKTALWNLLSLLDVHVTRIISVELVRMIWLGWGWQWQGSGLRDCFHNQVRPHLHRNLAKYVEFCTVARGTCLTSYLPHPYSYLT